MIARSLPECSSGIFVRSDFLNLTIVSCIRAFLRFFSEQYMVSSLDRHTGTGNAAFSTCKSVFETTVASSLTHPKLNRMFCTFFLIYKMVCCFAHPILVKTRWQFCISFNQRWMNCIDIADLDFWDAYISLRSHHRILRDPTTSERIALRERYMQRFRFYTASRLSIFQLK